MRVLVACECSGAVRRAFSRAGHEAWSCDLQPAEDGSPLHIRGDAIVVAYSMPWDLLIAHPECTYLANSGAKHLYAAGMILSGVAMMLMMQLSILTPIGVATSGFTMGLATGLFWANRGFLALTATEDSNRNYYYGVENFVATLAAVAVPASIGWFISGTTLYGWLGGIPNRAYHIVARGKLPLPAE